MQVPTCNRYKAYLACNYITKENLIVKECVGERERERERKKERKKERERDKERMGGHLPFCGPGFESKAHHLCIFHL